MCFYHSRKYVLKSLLNFTYFQTQVAPTVNHRICVRTNTAGCARGGAVCTLHVDVNTNALWYFQESGRVVRVLSQVANNCLEPRNQWPRILRGGKEEALREGRCSWAEVTETGKRAPVEKKIFAERQSLPFMDTPCPLASKEPRFSTADFCRVWEAVSAVWASVKTWIIKMQINNHNSWPLNGTSS